MLETADYDHNDFTPMGMKEADKHLLVKFMLKPVKNMAKSREAGHYIYEEAEHVDIRIPGQKDSVTRKATNKDKNRFPEHYRMFKARMEAPLQGTPLGEWTGISRSQVEELSFKNIKTVEALADLNDNLASQFMGINTLKKNAKAWLEQQADDGLLIKLRTELEERDTTIAEQGNMIAKLTERLDAIEYVDEE